MIISFTKAKLPYGWLGNMSAYPVGYNGLRWRTAEALFQALRFADPGIQELIRAEVSPMGAKMRAKSFNEKMVVEPCSAKDIANMELVLRLKLDEHIQLKQQLLDTGSAMIVEDCTRRAASRWGAQFIDGKWVGDNLLGECWMRIRLQLRSNSSFEGSSVVESPLL